MAPPGGKDLSYKIFGLDRMQGEVVADVFAKQISSIIGGLKKADKSANGGSRFEYVIAGLKTGSAEIEFREKVVSEKPVRASPASKFLSVGATISSGVAFAPESEVDEIMLNLYSSLSKGAEESFKYATAGNGGEPIIRVDRFLNKQVSRLIASAKAAADAAPAKFFSGSAIGTFFGEIQAVDLKGDVPDARLILSPGGKPIECVLYGMDLSEVRLALGSRVSVTGTAIYEGQTGLPSRIEIRKIQTFEGCSIERLAGSLKPMNIING